jgi:uncharacterized coiled-coil protein SlyX
MNGNDHDAFERMRDLEVGHARHDERIKSIEDFAREMRQAITGMQVKLAGIVAIVSIGVQVAFKFWR